MRDVSLDKKSALVWLILLGTASLCVFLWQVIPGTPSLGFFPEKEPFTDTLSSSADSGKQTVSTPLPQGTPYITVDIEEMSVVLHSFPESVETFHLVRLPEQEVLENIQGTYIVGEKSTMQLSTIAMARFPYYVSFGDGYAFHGTPTNTEGKALNGEYAQNMFELENKDAEKLFTFVDVGTPIVVEGEVLKEESNDVYDDTPLFDPAPPTVSDGMPATSAKAYAVVDIENGQYFIDKGKNDRYPIASVTKLVTALTATEIIGHGTEVKAPNNEYYVLSDLYYPLLLQSNNAVAASIARHAGTSFFISSMNTYVESLGMQGTVFSDASGLSPKNVSSVSDLVILAKYLYTEKDFILEISKEASGSITSTNGVRWNVKNQNKLASDPYFIGGKLGYTDEAGQTSLAIFRVPIYGEFKPIAVIILQSKDWKQDTRTLLRWLVANTQKNTETQRYIEQ